MTKLEKIREILREYENGADSSVNASVILSGITNVLNDPIFTEHEPDKMRGYDIMRKETPAGELCAFVSGDTDNPAVGIYLIPKDGDGAILDLAYAEVKGEELMEIHNEREREELTAEDVCLYTYADPYTEEFTQRNIIKRDDVVKALEIENDDMYKGIDAAIKDTYDILSRDKQADDPQKTLRNVKPKKLVERD